MSSEQTINILVAEDEAKVTRLIGRRLIHAGYTVGLAFNGIDALEKATKAEWQLIILDLNLPLKSGFDVLKDLRARSYPTPVLVISAREAVGDRVKCLQMGADDYLSKPFDMSELLARAEAILRRSGTLRTSILQAGDLTMDMIRRCVQRAGKTIELTQKEFALLEFFLRNKNQLLTRMRIAEAVWGYTFDTGTNIVDVYVAYLRKSLEDTEPHKLIQTIPGEGFMLVDE